MTDKEIKDFKRRHYLAHCKRKVREATPFVISAMVLSFLIFKGLFALSVLLLMKH